MLQWSCLARYSPCWFLLFAFVSEYPEPEWWRIHMKRRLLSGRCMSASLTFSLFHLPSCWEKWRGRLEDFSISQVQFWESSLSQHRLSEHQGLESASQFPRADLKREFLPLCLVHLLVLMNWKQLYPSQTKPRLRWLDKKLAGQIRLPAPLGWSSTPPSAGRRASCTRSCPRSSGPASPTPQPSADTHRSNFQNCRQHPAVQVRKHSKIVPVCWKLKLLMPGPSLWGSTHILLARGWWLP